MDSKHFELELMLLGHRMVKPSRFDGPSLQFTVVDSQDRLVASVLHEKNGETYMVRRINRMTRRTDDLERARELILETLKEIVSISQ